MSNVNIFNQKTLQSAHRMPTENNNLERNTGQLLINRVGSSIPPWCPSSSTQVSLRKTLKPKLLLIGQARNLHGNLLCVWIDKWQEHCKAHWIKALDKPIEDSRCLKRAKVTSLLVCSWDPISERLMILGPMLVPILGSWKNLDINTNWRIIFLQWSLRFGYQTRHKDMQRRWLFQLNNTKCSKSNFSAL